MSKNENVELTNMCMICDGKGNVLVQDKKDSKWGGWSFPGGHVEKGEAVTASVIREVLEETGMMVKNPLLCGIKEFHKSSDGNRYIVFLYRADDYFGELKSSSEGEVFWCPFEDLKPENFAPDFDDMLRVFTDNNASEVFYERKDGKLQTVFY